MSTESPMIRLAPVPLKNSHTTHLLVTLTPNAPTSSLSPSLSSTKGARSYSQRTSISTSKATRGNLRPVQQRSRDPLNFRPGLSHTIPAVEFRSAPRSAPASFEDEFWYARRSYHHNLSVKHNSPGTASWQEFVYGLRDQHSKHEYDFTPTIYDAHLVVEWNEALNAALASLTRNESEANRPRYTHATMSIYEMCHKLPNIVGPRCFPVLVITANVSSDEFIAVTVPVNIRNFQGAFYSNGRHKKEGVDSQMRKSVTLGEYCAVERVHKYPAHDASRSKTGDLKAGKAGSDAVEAAAKTHTHSRGEDGEEVEWVMATASHTRGSLPMVLQRMGVPGSIAKDVGLFLKWIRKVPEEEIRSQKVETSTARPV